MVNNDGSVLMDEYVQPQEAVTDYRTAVSGILPSQLKAGAVGLQQAQQQVTEILKGRILVGHAVHHDLQVGILSLAAPQCMDSCEELGQKELKGMYKM